MLGMWDLAQARAGAWTWEKLVLARCMALGKLFLLYDLVVLVFFFLNIFKLFPLILSMRVPCRRFALILYK